LDVLILLAQTNSVLLILVIQNHLVYSVSNLLSQRDASELAVSLAKVGPIHLCPDFLDDQPLMSNRNHQLMLDRNHSNVLLN
jgi:hypothetical protein